MAGQAKRKRDAEAERLARKKAEQAAAEAIAAAEKADAELDAAWLRFVEARRVSR